MPIKLVTKAPAKANVSVEHMSKGQTTTEEHTEESVETGFKHGEHPGAEVEISTSATINTGNYNSVRVGATLRLHVSQDEIDEAAVFIEDWLNKRMGTLTAEIEAAAE